LPAECETLREKAHGFIAEELAAGYWTPNSDFGSHRDAGFSRRRAAPVKTATPSCMALGL
jgi:hypothetical protein